MKNLIHEEHGEREEEVTSRVYRHDMIAIGASAGGVEALMAIVRGLPTNFAATLFIVLHIPADSPSMLPELLSRAGDLPATHPVDGEEIHCGHIYVAPPDRHLLVEQGYIRVVRGPKENRHRPSVDVLFRSLARAYGPRAIGVVLTGALDDGTAGLLAIKRRNGLAVVQDPDDALYPSMPQSALDHVDVDYSMPLANMAALLNQLNLETVQDMDIGPVPEDMETEVKKAEAGMQTQRENRQVGTPSAYSCPECGGVLWEIQDGKLIRFRCRVGHAFTTDSMIAEQSEALEEALWVALKILQEQSSISRRMAEQAHANGRPTLARRFEERQQDAEQRATLLMNVLTTKDGTLATLENDRSE